ncbi:response regulator transcription factor [Paenibacillus piri]|uniref:Response regulator n=1 Tax=Paenibacillus piri TaxID=2547395 RepID=A0A4R5KWX9_9BACL|nr:response regulator [Paenibacillus piri]TDF99688.1 response regulator [Paenibacillus piri]
MLNIILIDDEATNIELLKRVLDWEALGYTISGTAYDGAEGLALYRRIGPDVILVDIRMPEMDGIAFIKEVRKSNTRVKMIILSAYAEFEYAQQAIEYGIHAYLLKPIDEMKLEELLLAIKEEQQSEMAKSRSMIELRYQKLLHWAETSTDAVPLPLAADELADIKPFCLVCLAYEAERNDPTGDSEAAAFLQAAIRQQPGCVAIRSDKSGGSLTIVYEAEETAIQTVVATMMELDEQCRRRYGQRLTCGISQSVIALSDFCLAYVQAVRALHAGFYRTSSASVALYEGEPPFPDWNAGDFAKKKREISEDIQSGRIGSLQRYLEQTMDSFRENRVNPEDMYRFCVELIDLLHEVFTAIDPQFGSMFEPLLSGGVRKYRRWESLKRAMEEIIVKSGSALRSLVDSNKNYAVIRKAKEFALLHFHEEQLHLQDVADHVGLSKNHFSKMYKEQTGENFWDYVIELKLELAKQMLRETNKTNFEIASLIGYSSEYHFSRTFGKQVGLTTTQYRKLHRN